MRRLWLERNARTFDRRSSNVNDLVVATVAEIDCWAQAKKPVGSREE
jgi:hypothetical protein